MARRRMDGGSRGWPGKEGLGESFSSLPVNRGHRSSLPLIRHFLPSPLPLSIRVPNLSLLLSNQHCTASSE